MLLFLYIYVSLFTSNRNPILEECKTTLGWYSVSYFFSCRGTATIYRGAQEPSVDCLLNITNSDAICCVLDKNMELGKSLYYIGIGLIIFFSILYCMILFWNRQRVSEEEPLLSLQA